MTHPERDLDLLLLAHGTLSPLRAALTQWHLSRCPDCRLRLNQFRTVSHSFAGQIRDPHMPRWSFPAAGPTITVLAGWFLALTLLGVLIGTLVVHGRRHIPISSPLPVAGGPCRPDLPNDRCH